MNRVFVGATVSMTLLTRDAKRYRTYYPTLKLICPPETSKP